MATNKTTDKKVAKTEVKAAEVKAVKVETKVEAKADAKKETKEVAAKVASKAEVTAPTKAPAKKACATKSSTKTAKKSTSSKASKPAVKLVEVNFESIFNAIASRAKKAKFTTDFMATQITLKGSLECQPLYVKVEDKKAEVAPYEYNNACFYIDADAEVLASILNGKKDVYDAIAAGSVAINGDASKAILFVKAIF